MLVAIPLPPELSTAFRFCEPIVDGIVIVVEPVVTVIVPVVLALPLLLAVAVFPAGRSKTLIVVEDDASPLIDAVKMGLRSPVIAELPPKGAKTSRPNGT